MDLFHVERRNDMTTLKDIGRINETKRTLGSAHRREFETFEGSRGYGTDTLVPSNPEEVKASGLVVRGSGSDIDQVYMVDP
jgi:hypothetical protein